jgi:DNA-binding XRE family transcriptional regulator
MTLLPQTIKAKKKYMRKQMDNSDFKKARQQLGLTQLQLAKKLGLTNRQIIRLEQDHPIQKQTALAMNQLVTLSSLDE